MTANHQEMLRIFSDIAAIMEDIERPQLRSLRQLQQPPYESVINSRKNEERLIDWISTATSATGGHHAIPLEYEPSSLPPCYPSYIDGNYEHNHPPSVCSQEWYNEVTLRSIEEVRATKFRRQLVALPRNLYEQYKRHYPSYDGTQIRFIEACAFIRKFSITHRYMIHPFLWDDMVRVLSCYKFDSTAPDLLFGRYTGVFLYYHRSIEAPQFVGGLLNQRTLDNYTLIDPQVGEQITSQMNSEWVEWVKTRRMQENQDLDRVLQQAVMEDMEGIHSG